MPLYANLRDFNLRRILVPCVETASGSRNEFVTGVVDIGNSFEFEDQAFLHAHGFNFLGENSRERDPLCLAGSRISRIARGISFIFESGNF